MSRKNEEWLRATRLQSAETIVAEAGVPAGSAIERGCNNVVLWGAQSKQVVKVTRSVDEAQLAAWLLLQDRPHAGLPRIDDVAELHRKWLGSTAWVVVRENVNDLRVEEPSVFDSRVMDIGDASLRATDEEWRRDAEQCRSRLSESDCKWMDQLIELVSWMRSNELPIFGLRLRKFGVRGGQLVLRNLGVYSPTDVGTLPIRKLEKVAAGPRE